MVKSTNGLTAATLLALATGHKWFAKDHWKRAQRKSDSEVKQLHEAIATMHEETAAILRVRAKKVKEKPC